MLFDCAAISIGLCGAVAARLPPGRRFGSGDARVELLSSFVNSVLLLLGALSVGAEAVTRLRSPPEVIREWGHLAGRHPVQ